MRAWHGDFGLAMPLACTISDLRQRPEFFDSVADRIWQAWWKADGHPLEYISGRLRENLSAAAIPFARPWRRRRGSRQYQPFAAMKIDRPNPVR